MSREQASRDPRAREEIVSKQGVTLEDRSAQIERYRSMLAAAYQDHWRELDQFEDVLPYFSYGLVEEIRTWALPMMGDQLLSSDFNELINAVNAWDHRLRSWAAWNLVLARIPDEHDRWDVRTE